MLLPHYLDTCSKHMVFQSQIKKNIAINGYTRVFILFLNTLIIERSIFSLRSLCFIQFLSKTEKEPFRVPFHLILHYTALGKYHREEFEAIKLAILADDDVLVGDHIVQL